MTTHANPNSIRIGVQLWPGGVADYRTWRDAVRHAEDLGVDVIFGYDHFHRPAVEIGLLVTGIGYRNPDLLADMARTVDHISGGRLILGLGSGWYEKDYDVYGYEYGTVASRMDLFEAGLARLEHRFGQLVPAPLRHIPILIGGSGERRTMPLVARHADIWHSFLDIESFRTKNRLLERLADDAGRDHTKIERAVQWTGADEAKEYVAEGVTLFTAEIHPDSSGYDFTEVQSMLAWRRAP